MSELAYSISQMTPYEVFTGGWIIGLITATIVCYLIWGRKKNE